jgi:DNA-binding response OmpR family regulator
MTESADSGRPRILVADDDEDILELVSLRFEGEGYNLLTARDGEEALSLALDQRPDLAVLDLRMPKLNGYEVTQRIRACEALSSMPVIILSAAVQEAKVARGFQSGADEYLKKPFSPNELVARVQAFLAQRLGPT